MNKRQLRTVERIWNTFLPHHHGKAHVEKYEFKRFEVEDLGRSTMVILESGMKNDEKTMASIVARTTYQIFIGPRGRIDVHDLSFGSHGKVHRSAGYLVMGW